MGTIIKAKLYHTMDECDSNNLPSRNFNPRFHEDRLATKDTKMTKFPVCISGGDKFNARFFRSPFEYL